MPAGIRARLVAGDPNVDYAGSSRSTHFYEASQRRAMRLMCDGCKHGMHSVCESERCPCVCNDSDFRWSRKAPKASQIEQAARVIAIRPELEALFR